MASVDDLDFIIGPTAWWTETLSGNTFKRVPGLGYINNTNEFIIVSSCSGINFLIVLFSTLLYSFIHRLSTKKGKLLWLVFGLLFSYIITIGVNGLRIILSMYLFNLNIYGAFITPERVHRLEGVVVYFVSLFILFLLLDRKVVPWLCKGACEFDTVNSRQRKHLAKPMKRVIMTCVPPIFWYFMLTVGIPIVNSGYKKEGVQFLEHSAVIISVSLVSVLVYYLISKLKHVGISDRINKSM